MACRSAGRSGRSRTVTTRTTGTPGQVPAAPPTRRPAVRRRRARELSRRPSAGSASAPRTRASGPPQAAHCDRARKASRHVPAGSATVPRTRPRPPQAPANAAIRRSPRRGSVCRWPWGLVRGLWLPARPRPARLRLGLQLDGLRLDRDRLGLRLDRDRLGLRLDRDRLDRGRSRRRGDLALIGGNLLVQVEAGLECERRRFGLGSRARASARRPRRQLWARPLPPARLGERGPAVPRLRAASSPSARPPPALAPPLLSCPLQARRPRAPAGACAASSASAASTSAAAAWAATRASVSATRAASSTACASAAALAAAAAPASATSM